MMPIESERTAPPPFGLSLVRGGVQGTTLASDRSRDTSQFAHEYLRLAGVTADWIDAIDSSLLHVGRLVAGPADDLIAAVLPRCGQILAMLLASWEAQAMLPWSPRQDEQARLLCKLRSITILSIVIGLDVTSFGSSLARAAWPSWWAALLDFNDRVAGASE